MIASDGSPFEKIEVNSFIIFAGERFDFVLNASQPVGNYWIRVRGLGVCGFSKVKQVSWTSRCLKLRYMSRVTTKPT
jgi:hypothetical protein